MAITLGRRLAVLVVAVLVALMMVAGTALAVPGNGEGYGQGIGGGKHNNPGNHFGQIKHDECGLCNPF